MAKTADVSRGFSDEMKTFFRDTKRKFVLSGHHLRVLACACEAHDRMRQAQRVIDVEGLTTKTKGGELRAHPATNVEIQSRTSFVRCLRELGLADEVPDELTRPPRLTNRYAGRK
jgi:P27 family predicted phage terminase small subunit